MHYRVIKPKDQKLNIKANSESDNPKIVEEGNTEELIWERFNTFGIPHEQGTPEWYNPYNKIELSDYQTWEEVGKWGEKLFIFDPDLKSDSLNKLIEQIKKEENASERILKAVRYVQDDIRYFGIEIGENSHLPKKIDKIISDKFGDCKDKVHLLRYILNKLDIKSYPILVNSVARDQVREFIPSPAQFNHAVIMVDFEGQNFFFDPTQNFQGGNIYQNYFPGYHYGLILNYNSTDLTEINTTRTSISKVKETYKINSFEGNTELDVSSTFWGYMANGLRNTFSITNSADIEKGNEKFYSNIYGEVKSLKKFNFSDDRYNNTISFSEKYKIDEIWKNDRKIEPGWLKTAFSCYSILGELNQISVQETERLTPLELPFPSERTHTIEVYLPDDFTINPESGYSNNIYLNFSYNLKYSNKKVTFTCHTKFNRAFVEAKDYPKFIAELKAIKEHVVFNLFYNLNLKSKIKDGNVNWQAVTIAIMLSIILIILFVFIYSRISAVKPVEQIVPLKIGGVLWIPLTIICINILYCPYLLLFNGLLSKTTWLQLTDETSKNYFDGASLLIYYNLFTCLIILHFSVFSLILFLKNKMKAPMLLLSYFVTLILLYIIDHIIKSNYFDNSDDEYLLILKCVVMGIWIPYFIRAKRVKETFVE